MPGCITVGETVEQTRKHMEEAIELYVEELTETGEIVPTPRKLQERVNMIGNLKSGTFIAFVPNHTDYHAKSA